MGKIFYMIILPIMGFLFIVASIGVSGLNFKIDNKVELTGIAPPIFEYAHHYHGIKHSKWDLEKKCWTFERNNQKCRIFTKSFWDWYMKNYKERKNEG